MLDEEQVEHLQMLLPRRTNNGLELLRNRGFKPINGRNDAATFLPLSTKGGLCISHNSKHVNPSGENTVKITSNKANDGIEMNKNYSPKANDGIEINENYSPDEMTKDTIIKPYKEVILKEPTKTKDQVPMEQ